MVEGAGGALVPVTRTLLYADLFAAWRAPVVIVARTGLGTINHSLLTIEALRARGVAVHGVAFIGAVLVGRFWSDGVGLTQRKEAAECRRAKSQGEAE